MKRNVFTQLSNDEKNIIAIADGYKTKITHDFWLADGLQKDAVQNSWDARIDKENGKGWECGFSLENINNKDYLCIVDSGTTGLNGTKFHTEKELVKILINNKHGEDLAYFLNSNWSAKSTEEGGNRGRGKTLFLVTSKNRIIFFDSFRSSDGSYIFGTLFLDKDKRVKFELYYDVEAQGMLKEFSQGKIQPLKEYGTRIFILNPEEPIKDSIRSGEIISFISYSWWEIIKKYGAKIFLDDNKEKKYATLPYWYEDKIKRIKEKVFLSEIIKDGTSYKIKKLILRYAPNLNLPEKAKGIAIQRGGIMIEHLLAEDLVHEEGMIDIYGWIEMESKPLEQEMKINCEGAEHFDFSWNTKPAKQLKDYIRFKIRNFAKELKIIESEQSIKNKIQKTAEEEALKSLSPWFKKLGLFGKHGMVNKSKKNKKFKRKPDELLRLSMPDLEFPREIKRVNYGEKIKGTYVLPINDSRESILVLVRIFLISSTGKIEIIEEKEINLNPGNNNRIGPEFITISDKYDKGGYSLRARMISLENKNNILLLDGSRVEKGTVLYDRINKKFYIEVDPPESGPFNFQPISKDEKDYLFEWEPEEGNGYIIFYNDLHPRIKKISDDVEKLTEYLIEQGSLIAIQIKLEELIAEDDKDYKDFRRLIKLKDPTIVWSFFIKKYSEFLWDRE